MLSHHFLPTFLSLFFIPSIFNPTKHTLNQGRQFCIVLTSTTDIYLHFMILHTISPLYASCICWENTWKIQFCISYKNMQWNITGLLHLCEIACNVWVLETKNKEAYLDATKFKTKLNLTSIQQFVQDVWSLNQFYMYLFIRITKCLFYGKTLIYFSLFNHTHIFAHNNYFI